MPQAGIFALGTASHAYLEFDLLPRADGRALVPALADLPEPRTTIGGVNLVIGVGPELWRDRLGAAAPAQLTGFVDGTENPSLAEAPEVDEE
jgi:putative iron-dependent peroxidase